MTEGGGLSDPQGLATPTPSLASHEAKVVNSSREGHPPSPRSPDSSTVLSPPHTRLRNCDPKPSSCDLRTRLAALAVELAAIAQALAVPEPEPPAAQSLASWYTARAASLEHSSEEEDRLAALAAGFAASREVIRELRRQHAPEHWSRPGRRSADIAWISRQRRI